uniref:Uncharacterized protein n=1 Tax=Arundo donax TaxID=35708 RepID=A0A0A8XR91_ARUDO
MEEEEMPHLPLDIINKIPTHTSDPASLVRAASSCKLWRDIIKDSTFLDGLKTQQLDHGFTSSLLLGFFYQDSTEAPEHLWQHHKDKSRCLAPSFIPTSGLLPFTGCKEGSNAATPLSLGSFIQGFGSSLNFYEPVFFYRQAPPWRGLHEARYRTGARTPAGTDAPLRPSHWATRPSAMSLLYPKTISWLYAVAYKTAKVVPDRIQYVSAIL